MKIKKLLSVCLVIGIIASLYPVCTFATEGSTEKYVTIYEQDFTSANATTDGWTAVDMDITDAGFGNTEIVVGSTPPVSSGYAIFNQNLGDNYKVSGSLSYSGNIANFYLNSDAVAENSSATINNGYCISQNKVYLKAYKIIDGYDAYEYGHYAFSELAENGEKNNDFDLTQPEVENPTNVDFEVTYNKGKITYTFKYADNIVNSFEYTISAPEHKSGLFAIAENSYDFVIKNIKIEKAMSEYITVYEQDFSADDASTDGWIMDGMSLVEESFVGKTVKNDTSLSGTMIYNENLGEKYKVSGSIYFTWNGLRYLLNSDATETDGTITVKNAYRVDQNKQTASIETIIDGQDWTVNGNYKLKENNNTSVLGGYEWYDFEVIYDNGVITYNFTNSSGAVNSITYDVADMYAEYPRNTSGYFGINCTSDELFIKNIKIEKAASEYIPLYEQDFSAENSTADGWILDGFSITDDAELGKTVVSRSSLTEPLAKMVYTKNLGENYKVSGSIWFDYNGLRFLINSDIAENSGVITVNDAYRIDQNKQTASVQTIINGEDLGVNGNYKLKETNNTSVLGGYEWYDFEIVYNKGVVTYSFANSAGLVNSITYDMADMYADYPRHTNGYFGIEASSEKLAVKNIKIETVSVYAISDVKATNDNGEISYSALVYNWDGSLNDPALIAAVFDANGVMIDAKLIDYDGTAGINSVSGTITVDSEKVPDNVTIFFWQNLDKAAPLCDFKTCEL